MESTKGRTLCAEDDVDTRELIDFVLRGAQGYLVKHANGDKLIAEVTRLIAESKTTSRDRCVTAEDGGGHTKANRRKYYENTNFNH